MNGIAPINMMKPKHLLHLEGAAVFSTACLFYQQIHGSWLWFALLLLTPDIFMLGYLVSKPTGAAIYNLVHTYTLPLLLLSGLWLAGESTYLWLDLKL